MTRDHVHDTGTRNFTHGDIVQPCLKILVFRDPAPLVECIGHPRVIENFVHVTHAVPDVDVIEDPLKQPVHMNRVEIDRT